MARIRTRDGRVTGVTLASGESIDAPVVVTTAHPQISFLRLLDPAELPAGFVADIRGLAQPQRHREDQPGAGPAAGFHGVSRS